MPTTPRKPTLREEIARLRDDTLRTPHPLAGTSDQPDEGCGNHPIPEATDGAELRERVHTELLYRLRTTASHYRSLGKHGGKPEDGWISNEADNATAAILTAIQRNPGTTKCTCGMREQITTAEELDALPVGTVVLDRHKDAWQKVDDTDLTDSNGKHVRQAWASPSWTSDRTARQMFDGIPQNTTQYAKAGPFRVIHHPHGQAPTTRAQRHP